MKAVFKTKGKRGMSTKRITVYSNDPDTPKLFLTLKGEIILDVAMTPPNLSFGDTAIGQTGVQTAELQITEPDKIRVKSVTSDDKRFAAKLIPGSTPGKSTVEVTFLGSKTQERIASVIKIALEGEGASEAELPVRVQVVGNLRYPKQIFLMKTADTFNTRDIEIVSRSGAPFKIKSATDPDNRVKLDFPKSSEKEARVVASVRDPKMSIDQSVRGTIKIETTDPVDSTVEVGYTISMRRSSEEIHRHLSQMKAKSGALPMLKAAKGAAPEKETPVL